MAKQNEMRTRRASDSQIDRYLFICLSTSECVMRVSNRFSKFLFLFFFTQKYKEKKAKEIKKGSSGPFGYKDVVDE